uniref:hypothetical protein n=1 Tax=uncultured Sphingomonas sp. TaxID=158754 RepID=UPI0035C94FD1
MRTETRAEQYRRVHIEADRRAPFSAVRVAEPTRTPRYGAPGLIDRALSRVFG